MATHVWESTVIDAPIATVWELVRPVDFSYNPHVLKCALEGKEAANEVGSHRIIQYKDNTVQKLRLTELSDLKHSVSWDLVESTPAHHVMSASYSVRLRSITQGALTFVEWSVDFSKDVTNEVSVDAKFKAHEAFKQIAATSKAKMLDAASKAQIGKAKVSLPQLQRQLSAKSAQLQSLFKSLDKNHNGVLEFDEFALAVNKLYGENLSDEAIRLLLRQADTNNDSAVSYEEFVKFLAAEGLENKAQAIGDVKAPELALHYFNARGRAEVTRLMLAEASIKYSDNRHEFKHFQENLKAKASFGQMPYMLVGPAGKEKMIAQSQAINRYVAKLTGLYGKTHEDMARIDMYCEHVEDIVRAWGAAWYEKDAAQKEAKVAKFLTEQMPTMLAFVEKHLAAAPKGQQYVAGAFSMADVMLFDIVTKFQARRAEVTNATPLVAQLVTRVASRPNIAAWLKARPVTEN